MTDSASSVPRAAAILNTVGILSGLSLIAMAHLDVSSPVRVWLAVVLFMVGPGSAIVQLVRIQDLALQIGLVFAISAAVDIIVAQLLLFAHHITPLTGAIAITAVTCSAPLLRWSQIRKGAEVPQ